MNRWFPQRPAQVAALFQCGRVMRRICDFPSSRLLPRLLSHRPYLPLDAHAHEACCVAWLSVCLAAGAPATVAAIPNDPRPGANSMSAAERDFVRTAEPLFKQFCFDCHRDKKAKAGVNLQRMSVDPDFADLFKSWEKVIVKLEQKEMPPEEKPQPTEVQRKKLIASVRG